MAVGTAVTFQDLYDELYRYVHWLAARRASDHVLLQRDELEGELYLEVWKGWLHYKDNELPLPQFLAVVRKMLDNRIGELVHRFYGTHRQVEVSMLDYDSLVDGSGNLVADPAMYVEQCEKFWEFIKSLTVDECEIVQAVLSMDERVAQQVKLIGWRKMFVYSNGGTVRVCADMVADALHEDRKVVRRLWRVIENKWRLYDEE